MYSQASLNTLKAMHFWYTLWKMSYEEGQNFKAHNLKSEFLETNNDDEYNNKHDT